MWFKNLIIYRLPTGYNVAVAKLNECLATQAFQPCTNSEMQSQGWVPPREDGEIAHLVNGQILLQLKTEKKVLPSSVINLAVKNRAIEVEEQQGYKPGRNQLKEIKEPVKATLSQERVLTESSDHARELYNQSRYGDLLEDGRVQFSLIETLYLIEKKKVMLYDLKNKPIDFDAFLKKSQKVVPNFWVRYSVYKDIRNRGYIIKTALKFGADFRIYDRGVKPGEDHARWVVFPVHEGSSLTWYEFSAKNRVAHSTKKRLLIGCVDDEGDVTYWEVRWLRP